MSIQFKLSAPHRISHFAEIEMTVDTSGSEEITFELPSWRPGRYELGNFAKNIRKWKASNERGQALAYKKTSKDSWQVSTDSASKVIIRYEYFCCQADAGACWIDEHQIYINPVHCFLFIQERLHESCILELNVPKNYQIATSLKKADDNVFFATDFHELYDSPFIASDSLQHKKYRVNETDFFIWMQGKCKPDWDLILKDFKALTEEQFGLMGDFPFEEYHFLVQVLPYNFYHGVEHLKSTVLVIGPGEELMSQSQYENLTGLASHELFHAWNVKTIRPAEMHPYNYKKENYSRLGYVYEGVTSYYGDLILARSKVYSSDQFFNEINARLQKHFDNPGRFNLSVADSSFDTWLDGYSIGIPGRKSSIYDEGCITAMMTDLLIRKKTNGQFSLDDVMKTLYFDFGKKNIGYSEHDYISIVEYFAKDSFADFFLDFVYGVEDDEKFLNELLAAAGCELNKRPSGLSTERYFGFKTVVNENRTVVSAIAAGSPAFLAGLGLNDEIVAVNENKIEQNIDALLKLYSGETIVLTVISPMNILKDLALTPSSEDYFSKYSIVKNKIASKECKEFFKAWLKQEFEESFNYEMRRSS